MADVIEDLDDNLGETDAPGETDLPEDDDSENAEGDGLALASEEEEPAMSCMEQVVSLLQEVGLPFAYSHFAEGESPDPPFICYLFPGSNNFSADGRVYFKCNRIQLELYTDLKDPVLEERLESVLDGHGIYYEKTETWIPAERLYEVLYYYELPGPDGRNGT